MRVAELDYELPEACIAQAPCEPRDASRLLVLPRREGTPRHLLFSALPELLAPGDLLIMNNSRVIPARLLGRKGTGGRCEVLLVEPLDSSGARWRALAQTSKALRAGSQLRFEDLVAEVEAHEGEGFVALRFDRGGAELEEAITRIGRVPLPPYIRREPCAADRERYQTVIARTRGSVAAPTAGLHFTPSLLERLDRRGVVRAEVTLHVGPGTFLPVRGDRLEDHRMHAERYEVPPGTARAFAGARARGSRVVAVGTTSVRTLEAAFRHGELSAGSGRTDIFIFPGFEWRAVDGLVTNFHLPRSTLLALVCAFAGTERVLGAYREAVREGYRFFSYGDAMLVL